MKLFSLNKALVWKEWRENRWIFWVGFILMSFTPIFQTLVLGVDQAIRPSFYSDATAWSGEIADMLNDNKGSLGVAGMLLAIGLGVSLIARERTYTLEFLVSTPVSRRDIINAKYSVGLGFIVIIMLANFLFVSGAALILPAKYTILTVVKWFALTGSVLITIFSLSFLVSTVTGTKLAAGIGALVVIVSPVIFLSLTAKILLLMKSLHIVSWGRQGSKIMLKLMDYLTLPHYLGPKHGFQHIWEMAFPWAIPVMLLVIAICYRFSVLSFERNHLEKNGQMLMFGNLRAILQVGVPLLAAIVAAVIVVDEYRPDAILVIAVFLSIYALGVAVFSMLIRVQNNLGGR